MPEHDRLKSLASEIREKLRTDSAFKQRDERGLWFCPYCARIIAHIQAPDDQAAGDQESPFQIAAHLLEECRAFADDADPGARLQPDAAEAPANAGGVPDDVEPIRRAALAQGPEPVDGPEKSWIRTARPATGGSNLSTQASPPPAPRVRAAQGGVVDTAAQRTKSGLCPPGQSALDEAVASVRKQMQEDEMFVQRDPKNRWFCPYCGTIVRSILLPEDMLLALQDVPFLIADHLVNECSHYEPDVFPTKRLTVRSSESKADPHVLAQLDEARRRQRHMLPSRTPALTGFEFECFYQPRAFIGGDFYDFIRVSDHQMGVVIGDVSGHGIEAAIIMAMVKKLIQVHGRGRPGAARTLAVTNADIADDMGEGVFISVFYGVLDTRTRRLTCARAGHPPPLIYNADRMDEPMKIDPHGLAIGLDRGPRFERLLEEWVVEFSPGDLFLAYTDGITELEDPSGNELGIQGLSDLMVRYGRRPLPEAIRQIVTVSRKFADNRPPDDDMSIVAFRSTENAPPDEG